MKNVPFLRHRRWSMLQTLTLTVLGCYQSAVSGEVSQGCVGSRLILNCSEMKVIQITDVVLGDSECYTGWKSCCIKDNDCTGNPNKGHRTDVQHRCNNRPNCTVNVIEQKIKCGLWGTAWFDNDFERITYDCRDDPQIRPTTTSTTGGSDGGWDTRNETYINETAYDDAWNTTTSAKDDQNNEIDNGKDEHTNVEDTAEWRLKLVSLVMVINGIVIVFIVIVLVIVKLRRNRCFRGKHSGQLCYIEIETIGANENQENHYSPCPSPTSSIPGNTSPETKDADGQMARSCENECYEAANDVVSSKLIKNCEGFTSNKDLHCDQKPVYTSPKLRARAHSPTLNSEEESELNVFTVLDNNIYCEVETMEPEKAASSKSKTSEETLKQGEHNDTRRITKTQSPMLKQKPIPVPLEIASTALKKDFPAKVESRGAVASKGVQSPIYESLTPRTPEAKLFLWPLTTRTISREDSEIEHPYCDMKWPPPKFEPDAESDASARSNSSRPIDDNNTYSDVDTWESTETGSSKGNNIEANQTKGQSNDMSTRSPMSNLTQTPELEAYNTFNKDCERNLDLPEKRQVSPNDVAQLTKMSEDLLDSYDIEPSDVWFTNGEGDTMIENDIYNH